MTRNDTETIQLRTSRVLPATPEEVFDAYTDAEKQKTTTIVITFEEHEGGTLLTAVQSGFPAPEVRDFFGKEVWAGALDRIGTYLRRSGQPS